MFILQNLGVSAGGLFSPDYAGMCCRCRRSDRRSTPFPIRRPAFTSSTPRAAFTCGPSSTASRRPATARPCTGVCRGPEPALPGAPVRSWRELPVVRPVRSRSPPVQWLALSAAMPRDWPILRIYFGIVTVLSLVSGGRLARVVRGKLLDLRELDFVMAARLAGMKESGIIRGHLLPNCAASPPSPGGSSRPCSWSLPCWPSTSSEMVCATRPTRTSSRQCE